MAKIKGAKIPSRGNFIGAGVASNDPGYIPKYSQGMGNYYGSGAKNPVGKMRSDSVGYRPVSKKQLGTAPKSLA